MACLHYQTADEAFHDLLRQSLHFPVASPRGQTCYEQLGLQIVIEDIEDPSITWYGIPERQAIYEKYREAEKEWYLSGNLKADSAPSKFWLKLADREGNITSNYGHMILHDRRIDNGASKIPPFSYAMQTLSRDRDSRQAIIHYGDPKHFWEGNLDRPCTVCQQFFIRNNRLYSLVTMRSNDVWLGFPYDVAWFAYIQKEMRNGLSGLYPGLELGQYIHQVGSFHLYERNLPDARKELEGWQTN